VAGGRARLHNEELHNLYTSPDVIRVIRSMMRKEGHVEHMGEMRNAFKILERTPEGKRPRGRPRHRWEDNIRKGLRVMSWEVVGWIRVAQDRDQWRAVVDTIMNIRVQERSGNFLTS
jgi:hypothetical protein